MTTPSFESLRVWHEARRLTQRIYAVTRTAPFRRDFSLSDQIRRASVSVMSNIAEGYERGGRRQFLHFLAIAKGSAGEVRSQLYTAQDAGYMDVDLASELREHAKALSRQIQALAETMMGE